MPDNENQLQNRTPEENSIPPSPQESTEPAPENTAQSDPSTMPSEAPEGSRNSESAILVNNANGTENKPEAISPEPEISPKIEEKSAS